MKPDVERPGWLATLPAIPIAFLMAAIIPLALIMLAPLIGSHFDKTGILFRVAQKTTILSMASAILAAIGIAGIVLRKAIHGLFERLADFVAAVEERNSKDNRTTTGIQTKSFVLWLVLSVGLIYLLYWPTALSGYFVHDDFSVMMCAKSLNLGDQLMFPNNDHTMPLYRLQVAATHALFGLNPLPYNLEYLGVFVVLLLFTCLVLRELGVNQIGILICALMLAFWANWAQLFAEGYIVTVFPQASMFFMVSAWAYLRWQASAHKTMSSLALAGALLGASTDIAGIWVPFALFVFAACSYWAKEEHPSLRGFGRSNRWLIAGLLTILLIFAAYNYYVFTVVLPGGFLSSANYYTQGRIDASGGQFAGQLASLFGVGVILSSIIPFHMPSALALPITIVFSLAAVAIGIVVWRRAERTTKAYIVGFATVALGFAIMVVKGRSMTGFYHIWLPKYVGQAYVCYCVLISLGWATIWRTIHRSYRPLLLQVTIIGLAFFVCCQVVQWSRGYRPTVLVTAQRKASLELLRDQVVTPLSAQQQMPAEFLNVDARFLDAHYLPLCDYSLSLYTPFIVPDGKNVSLIRNDAMEKPYIRGTVKTVTSLRNALNPDVYRLLRNSSPLSRLFFGGVQLRAELDKALTTESVSYSSISGASAVFAKERDCVDFESTGGAQITVDGRRWDPEVLHVLMIKAQALGCKESVRINVMFDGDIGSNSSVNWFMLEPSETSFISFDLLQLYRYSLSKNVGNLRLQFPVAGRYRITGLALAPN